MAACVALFGFEQKDLKASQKTNYEGLKQDIQDAKRDGELEVYRETSADNPADIGTKPLDMAHICEALAADGFTCIAPELPESLAASFDALEEVTREAIVDAAGIEVSVRSVPRGPAWVAGIVGEAAASVPPPGWAAPTT